MADHPLPLKEWETKTLTVLVHELCGEICEQKRSKEGRVYFCSQFKGAAYRGGDPKGQVQLVLLPLQSGRREP